MYNPFIRTKENAIMLYVFSIIDADMNIHQSEEAFLTLLGLKFGFSQLDLVNTVSMSDFDAVRTLSSMSTKKKTIAAALFTAVAMADGNTKIAKAEMDKYLAVLKKFSLLLDVKFADSLRIAHAFVDR